VGVRSSKPLSIRLLGRLTPPSGRHDLAARGPGVSSYHDIVDHRRRRLVAHADARRVFQRESAIGAGLADLDAEARLERGLNRREPAKPVDDVVAEPDRDPPLGVSDRKE
jgi:hypothetical protein